jgi:hypothetical protein
VTDQASQPYKINYMQNYSFVYLSFPFLDGRWEGKRIWIEQQQPFRRFNLLLISSRMQF